MTPLKLRRDTGPRRLRCDFFEQLKKVSVKPRLVETMETPPRLMETSSPFPITRHWALSISPPNPLVPGTPLGMSYMPLITSSRPGCVTGWQLILHSKEHGPSLKNVIYAPVNLSLFLALFLCFVYWFYIWRTKWGYELRAIGQNEHAASFSIHHFVEEASLRY